MWYGCEVWYESDWYHAHSGENIRGLNDMKGHYFTKLVTEQRRLGGTTWQRKDNLCWHADLLDR